ncbi:putative gamma-glutamylcyclotransferase [Capsicum chinense]|nr:putative gamma-glutamylcyclotransferase [Capsicum chinense]
MVKRISKPPFLFFCFVLYCILLYSYLKILFSLLVGLFSLLFIFSTTKHSSSISSHLPLLFFSPLLFAFQYLIELLETMGTEGSEKNTIIFTYGTLKRGFSNHVLLQDMIAAGDASFLGVYQTVDRLPLVCGPYRVPFLLNFPGSGEHVRGELYAVSSRGLIRMDELEGVTKAHYQRLPIRARALDQARPDEVAAEAYYAHENYAEALWKRNGQKGYKCYTEKEAKGYVKRKERPQHLTFLEQIGIFIASSSDQKDNNNPNSCYCNKHLPAAPVPIDVVNH